MALLLHYTGQDYISRGLLKTELTPGSTSAIVGGCKTGKGFSFTNNNITDAYTSMTTVNYNQLSISAWIRTNTNSTTGERLTIFSTSNDLQEQILFDVYDVNRLRIVVFFDDNTFDICNSTDNTILPNTWYFVTAQLNKVTRNMQVYINGVLINSKQYINKPLQDNNRFFIGRRFDSCTFRGHICNLKVYNHVLSQKEINEDYKSLMLHYKLDKPITTQVFDHSGFNRHITNLVNTKTNEAVGKVYGGSLKSVSGSVCHGSCNLTDWNGINEMSFACRFKVSELKKNYLFLNMNYTADGSGFFAVANPTSIQFYLCGTPYLVNYNWIIDTWYSVVLVKSPTNIYIYVNNVLIDSIASTKSSFSHTYTTYIAERFETPSYNLNGNIQDIRFYAKALTQEDVTELYQTRQEIDNLANGYCYELVERQSEVEMKANGQLYCDEVIENDDGTFSINKNKTIKTKEIKEV